MAAKPKPDPKVVARSIRQLRIDLDEQGHLLALDAGQVERVAHALDEGWWDERAWAGRTGVRCQLIDVVARLKVGRLSERVCALLGELTRLRPPGARKAVLLEDAEARRQIEADKEGRARRHDLYKRQVHATHARSLVSLLSDAAQIVENLSCDACAVGDAGSVSQLRSQVPELLRLARANATKATADLAGAGGPT